MDLGSDLCSVLFCALLYMMCGFETWFMEWKSFVLYALLCLETWTTMSPLCCSSNIALKILDYVLTKNMMMQQMAPTEKWAGFFWSSNMMRGKSIPYPLLNCSKCSAWHYMLRPHRRQQNQFLNNNGWRPNPNPSSLTRHTHTESRLRGWRRLLRWLLLSK